MDLACRSAFPSHILAQIQYQLGFADRRLEALDDFLEFNTLAGKGEYLVSPLQREVGILRRDA
jgi:hypothetical protein